MTDDDELDDTLSKVFLMIAAWGQSSVRTADTVAKAAQPLFCAAFLLIGAWLPAQPAAATAEAKEPLARLGSVEGTVTFRGGIPKSSQADDAGVRRQIIDVDEKSKGLRNAVVYLTRTNGLPLSPAPFSFREDDAASAVVDQENHEFAPRVIAVREGQPVVFSNSDPANHNVRTSAAVAKNEFNVFTGVDGKYEHRFVAQPGYRPIRLGCDIHPWMRGWVFVFDHPYFAVTDKQGRFRISHIPAGEFRLHIVQPDLKPREEQNIRISADETRSIKTVLEQKESASR